MDLQKIGIDTGVLLEASDTLKVQKKTPFCAFNQPRFKFLEYTVRSSNSSVADAFRSQKKIGIVEAEAYKVDARDFL